MRVMDRKIRETENGRLSRMAGIVRGVLVGFTADTVTPLVTFPGQAGTAAVCARTTVELHGVHIGKEVVLMFEAGDPRYPIVLGVLRNSQPCALPRDPTHVELDIDGRRLLVSAHEQVVLRCGKASITLTKAGKVLVEGTYLLSRSSGVNRIKGGSIQLN